MKKQKLNKDSLPNCFKMRINTSFLLLSLLFLILLSFTVTAKQTVEENGFRIEAEDQYWCQGIINPDGKCLIIADFLVVNTENSNKDIYIDTSFTDSLVVVDGYKDKKDGIYYKPDKDKTKIKDTVKIDKYSNKSFTVYFWAEVDGKFNVTVDDGTLTILDPLYNVTFNPQIPSYHLIGGDVMRYNYTQFQQIENITTELSDGNPNTYFFTSFATSPVNPLYLMDGWSFNEYKFYNTLHSFYGTGNGVIIGSLDTVNVGDYYGGYFDGVDDFVSILHKDKYNPSEHWSIAVKLNVSDAGSTQHIVSKIYNGDGFDMYIKQQGQVACEFNGASQTAVVETTESLEDNQQHIIVCVKDGDNHYLYRDGILRDTEVKTTGTIYNFYNLNFGADLFGANKFSGTISQVGIFNTSLNSSIIEYFEYNKSVGDMNNGYAVDVFFNHTYEPEEHNYFLYMKSNLNGIGTIRVMNNNNDTVLPQSYIDQTVSSQTTYIDITSILVNGSNYPLRIWSILGNNLLIDDLYLVESTPDNETPIINNCQINTTSIGCGEYVRYSCNVTDNQDVFKVFFTNKHNHSGEIHYLVQEAIQIPDTTIWYYDFADVEETNGTEIIEWTFVNATDLVNNKASYQPNLTIEHNCTYICIEDWQLQYLNYSCLINDTFLSLKYYTDANACGTTYDLPIDNGTYSYVDCDYCTPIPTNTSCIKNNSAGYMIEYDYLNCFYLTNLSSDNFTNITYLCYPLINELMVSYHTAFPEFKDSKDTISWIVKIPSTEYVGKEFSCLSYIKKNNQTIQTNPTKSSSLREKEDRTHFVTVNSQTIVYFTGENVKIDGIQEYIFGVKCSDGNNTLTSEYYVTPQLENLDFVATAYLWMMGNSGAVLFFIIFGIVVIGTGLWLWKKAKH